MHIGVKTYFHTLSGDYGKIVKSQESRVTQRGFKNTELLDVMGRV